MAHRQASHAHAHAHVNLELSRSPYEGPFNTFDFLIVVMSWVYADSQDGSGVTVVRLLRLLRLLSLLKVGVESAWVVGRVVDQRCHRHLPNRTVRVPR